MFFSFIEVLILMLFFLLGYIGIVVLGIYSFFEKIFIEKPKNIKQVSSESIVSKEFIDSKNNICEDIYEYLSKIQHLYQEWKKNKGDNSELNKNSDEYLEVILFLNTSIGYNRKNKRNINHFETMIDVLNKNLINKSEKQKFLLFLLENEQNSNLKNLTGMIYLLNYQLNQLKYTHFNNRF